MIPTTKTSWLKRMGYGAGDAYGGGLFIITSLLYLNFLTDVEGIAPALAGLIVFIGKVWDAVTDPVMGWISDRTRSRWGRRRVWFLAGAIPAAASFIMIWYSFGIAGEMGRFAWHLFAYLFMSSVFTVVMIPYNAVLPEIETDYNERTLHTSVRMTFSMGTSILCAVLPALIRDAVPGSAQLKYLVMSLPFAALFALAWIAVFFATRRADAPTAESADSATVSAAQLPHDTASSPAAGSPAAVSSAAGTPTAAFLSTLKNRPFRIYMGIFLLGQGSVDIILALFVYWLSSYLGRPGEFSAIMGVLLVCQLLGIPGYTPIARRYGKTAPLLIGIPLALAAMLMALLIAPGAPAFLVYIFAGLGGFGFAACTLVPFSILPDVADVDELLSGQRREGIYAGMATFSRKLVNGVSIGFAGLILQVSGYVKNSSVQSPGALLGIRLGLTLLPIAMLIATLIVSRRYPLGKREYDTLRAELDRRRNSPGEEATPQARATLERVTGLKGEKAGF